MFCSKKCLAKFYRQEAAEKRRREIICLTCGKTFSTTRVDKKYCCDACRKENTLKIKKERYDANKIAKTA